VTQSSGKDYTEFARGWPLILASFIGMMAGLTALPFYAYGVFAIPLETAFGWTRAETNSALMFQTIGVLAVLPFLGWFCNKYGVRRVALISLFLFGVMFAALSLLQGNIYQYYATALIFGIVGAGTLPITWTRAINGAFDDNRGLALGFALMGTGVTGFIVPKIATWGIEAYGWQNAYLMLAAIPLFIGLPIVFLFFKDGGRAENGTEKTEDLPGVTFRQALKDYRFWVIAIGFLIVSIGIGGSIQNLFPYFIGEGFGPAEAGAFLSTIGLSVIAGRLSTGFFLDRIWGPAVGAVLMSLPALSCFILSSGSPSMQVAYFATMLIGFAAGAEFDIIAYLASRYFGLKHYSKIYSFLYAAFSIGAAMGPPLFGLAFDSFGNYQNVFLISSALFVCGSIMLLFLGRYPKFDGLKEHGA
jgi:MFS family permease